MYCSGHWYSARSVQKCTCSDFSRLEDIRARVSVPLALHGGSDLSDEDIAKLIRCGLTRSTLALI